MAMAIAVAVVIAEAVTAPVRRHSLARLAGGAHSTPVQYTSTRYNTPAQCSSTVQQYSSTVEYWCTVYRVK